ncbi:MAG: primosomal protein N' [Lentisphaeria bacterium]|nr:primosomal protein N' [Lentisphaeria bacterium]
MQIPTAKVLINLSLDRCFDYLIPPHLCGKVKVGMKVMVPFGKGNSFREAYVVGLGSIEKTLEVEKGYKAVLEICANFPALSDNMVKLAEWMADYYCCAREVAVRALLPGAIRNGKIKEKTKKIYFLPDTGKALSYIEENPRAKGKHAVIQSLLKRTGTDKEYILFDAKVSAAVLEDLVKQSIVSYEEITVERTKSTKVQIIRSKPHTPTEEQAAVLKKIYEKMDEKDSTSTHTVLLHGVTASGKTEVYLQAISHAVELGYEAIVLVPEISLTPQTVERFRSRFGDMVSVLHSGLTENERYDEWMKVHSGKVRIAVGARSALFAPFRNIGLIIVDEEHDPSYKQSEAPRYNARDVAVVRGKLENCVVILGSATPSLESYKNALDGKYLLCEMKKRTDESIVLPEVKIIDMRLEADDDGRKPVFSKFLIDAVHKRIAMGEQSILFFNLRGYARKLVCTECGAYQAECPECSVAYTYHKRAGVLRCPRCAAAVLAPEKCPQCSSKELKYIGVGTEKIENISFEVFKDARIARMDSDVMTTPRKYEETLSKFRRGETDILVGTQMIAKGLHFPNVTLVGLINADIGLNMPDFRAFERGFQLITQVAGRAGRGEVPGEVLVQTTLPFNPAVCCAANHDFKSFYDEEILIREELQYPPFGHLMAVHFNGEDPSLVMESALELMEKVLPYKDETTLYEEPRSAHFERMKGKYRFIATFRYGNLAPLRRALRKEIFSSVYKRKKIDIYVDVDALSLL